MAVPAYMPRQSCTDEYELMERAIILLISNNIINITPQFKKLHKAVEIRSPKTVLVWVSSGPTLKPVSSMTNGVTIADPVCITETPLVLAHVERRSADQAGARRYLTMTGVRQVIARSS